MQIVIEIPEIIYDTIQSDEMISREQLVILQMHIMNGTLLPKGHGRLIDVDRLKEYINECECCNNCPKESLRCTDECTLPDYLTDDIERVLDAQSTIIEANKEDSK